MQNVSATTHVREVNGRRSDRSWAVRMKPKLRTGFAEVLGVVYADPYKILRYRCKPLH